MAKVSFLQWPDTDRFATDGNPYVASSTIYKKINGNHGTGHSRQPFRICQMTMPK